MNSLWPPLDRLDGVYRRIRKTGEDETDVFRKPVLVRWTVYYVIILFILLFGEYNDHAFFYFQFLRSVTGEYVPSHCNGKGGKCASDPLRCGFFYVLSVMDNLN